MSSAASSASPARAGATPVTMLISRRAEPGREQEFVEAMAAVTAAASRYPGYLGGHLVHPALPGDPGAFGLENRDGVLVLAEAIEDPAARLDRTATLLRELAEAAEPGGDG